MLVIKHGVSKETDAYLENLGNAQNILCKASKPFLYIIFIPFLQLYSRYRMTILFAGLFYEYRYRGGTILKTADAA